MHTVYHIYSNPPHHESLKSVSSLMIRWGLKAYRTHGDSGGCVGDGGGGNGGGGGG